MRNVLKYYLPPLLWILIAFIFTSFPEFSDKTKLPAGIVTLVHAGIFFVLCWLMRRAFGHQTAMPQLRSSSVLGAFLFCCIYGTLDEFHHELVPGRTSNVYSLIADAGGALLYVAIASIVSHSRDTRRTETKS